MIAFPAARGISFYNAHVAGLTSEQAELRDAVAGWADAEVAPRAADIDRTNQSPMDLWPKLGDMGLLGVTVAEEDGGLGRGYFEHTIVMEGGCSIKAALFGNKSSAQRLTSSALSPSQSFRAHRARSHCRMVHTQTSASTKLTDTGLANKRQSICLLSSPVPRSAPWR